MSVDAIAAFLSGHAPFTRPATFAAGEVFGEWRLRAFLGRGGSGEVYRAEHIHLGTFAAVKVLVRDTETARDRFMREARILSENASSAFPRFLGYGERDGFPFMAQELLEPMELPSADGDVASFILKLCTGVGELHRRGLVHRDLKPSNILCRPKTGEPVLIDFGLAKDTKTGTEAGLPTMTIVDGRAVGVGTPGFAAPEQFAGGTVSSATDVHALGMIVRACFRGKEPAVWKGIVRRATCSIPEERYATVELMARAIRGRHRLRTVGCVALLLAALAVLAVLSLLTFRSHHASASLQTASKPLALGAPEGTAPAFRTVRWEDVAETVETNGVFVTKVWLKGENLEIADAVVLKGQRKVYVIGPGTLDADLSGTSGVNVQLLNDCTLLNRTRIPWTEGALIYTVRGESYLNFVNLAHPPGRDIRGVQADSDAALVDWNGPLTRAEAKKKARRGWMELERRERERLKTTRDLRNFGVSDESRGF